MGPTGKTTVQHYITGLSLFLSPYHFLLAIDTATFTAPSLPAFQPFLYIRSRVHITNRR